MTKMHQNWTYGEKEDLYPYLDGEDDEIFEYAVSDKFFCDNSQKRYDVRRGGHRAGSG